MTRDDPHRNVHGNVAHVGLAWTQCTCTARGERTAANTLGDSQTEHPAALRRHVIGLRVPAGMGLTKQVTENRNQACHVCEGQTTLHINDRDRPRLGTTNAIDRHLGERQGQRRGRRDLGGNGRLLLAGEHPGIHSPVSVALQFFP